MAIYRLLQESSFEPDDTKRLGDAYELVLTELRLKHRDDPLTETIARCVIEIAQTGENDPARICALAVEHIRGLK